MDAAMHVPLTVGEQRTGLRVGTLVVPALASFAAGAIHAAAIGAHAEHDQAVVVFALAALFQLGWAALALGSTRAALALTGAVGNALLVGGWVLAKTSGISFVDGLEVSEAVQFADGLAAAFAAVAAVGAGVWLARGRPVTDGTTVLRAAALPVAVLTLAGMVSAATGHVHAEGAHGHDAAAAHAGDRHTTGGGAVVPPTPYDPTQPIDLGGVEGVTPEQQAEAENLIAASLHDLPQWSDPAVADAQGWHSIGDGVTGYEHYLNLEMMEDGRILDTNRPESLVYQLDPGSGKKELVAAMFMLEPGATLETVPSFGGKLLQWHIHNNLCFTTGDRPRVAGLTTAGGDCGAQLVKGTQVPMVHVWIRPHPCGPFAALEGIAGGQIKEGEAVWCDHVHGSG
jgi:hypothetical protein